MHTTLIKTPNGLAIFFTDEQLTELGLEGGDYVEIKPLSGGNGEPAVFSIQKALAPTP